MKADIVWNRILFSSALSFQLAAIILFASLGWTLDVGVHFLDWLLPLAVCAALVCVVTNVRYGKGMLITAILLSLVYFVIVRQAVVLR